MIAYVFPGQGSQFPKMGEDLYTKSSLAKDLFHQANDILGFNITEVMFGDNPEDLKQTKVTQPAIFIHSVILAKALEIDFSSHIVAGHSLGEFSALASANYLTFEDGLNLVLKRALSMQKACEENKSTMAAIIGLEDKIIEDICNKIEDIVVPANYNCPGQIVISGSNNGVKTACEELKMKGAKRAIELPVSGAFHSPIMESAKVQLEEAIHNTSFQNGLCPIYQNVNGLPTTNKESIKENLIKQLTSSVLWSQTMKQMINDGAKSIIEIGPGKVLQGLFKKIDRSLDVSSGSL